jgi:tRNA(Phe) wybutosine-synthesizing methylase Tyw3
MIATENAVENMTINIQTEIHVKASLETTWEALLEELGPAQVSDRGPMPMKLEAWPGGRWYRDLGESNGHWWGNVQAIKKEALLEIAGPLFMSYPVSNNLQYRLSEEKGGTLIQFHHTALGLIIEDHRKNVSKGWGAINERVKQNAESKAIKAGGR